MEGDRGGGEGRWAGGGVHRCGGLEATERLSGEELWAGGPLEHRQPIHSISALVYGDCRL